MTFPLTIQAHFFPQSLLAIPLQALSQRHYILHRHQLSCSAFILAAVLMKYPLTMKETLITIWSVVHEAVSTHLFLI